MVDAAYIAKTEGTVGAEVVCNCLWNIVGGESHRTLDSVSMGRCKI